MCFNIGMRGMVVWDVNLFPSVSHVLYITRSNLVNSRRCQDEDGKKKMCKKAKRECKAFGAFFSVHYSYYFVAFS